jgi:hypothetical protein
LTELDGLLAHLLEILDPPNGVDAQVLERVERARAAACDAAAEFAELAERAVQTERVLAVLDERIARLEIDNATLRVQLSRPGP